MSKLEEKELQELKETISKPNQILIEIGARLVAYNSIDDLVNLHKESIKEQQDKVKEIEDKYGKGSLNIDTGEITPLEEE
jgi:hypothetical protein